MVKLRSICQAVNDIRKSDPGTAMTEGFLRLLIENGDVSYEICGSRVCPSLLDTVLMSQPFESR